MSAAAYPTLFGARIWPAHFLKLYFPFFITGATAYFGVAYIHTKLSDAPDNKWVNIVSSVAKASEYQKLKADAEAYLKKVESGKH